MRVKRYVVDSMPEALQRIRSELGKDAVILSTKDIKTGGFLGLFSQKKIEVVAAVDANAKDNAAQTATQTPKPAAVHAEAVTQQMKTTPELNGSKRSDEDVMAEIRQLKKLMIQMAGESERGLYPESLSIWEERLRSHEFHTTLIEKVLEQLVDRFQSEFPSRSIHDMTDEQAAHILKQLLHEMLQRKPIKGIEQQTKFVQFIGPTGVGKTTTIAKLAAEQVLSHRAKVGLITSDTYRIAAVEQLRTYANILNVPLEVVNSPQELHKAHEKIGDANIVMMDTAGRNFRNEMFVSEMSSMLQQQEDHEVFLVLSLTMKYNDMRAVVQNFSRYHIDKVLFTKMDETESFGPIFNLLDEFEHLQLSYITTGQNVPDDICKLDADRLIDRIMGDEQYA